MIDQLKLSLSRATVITIIAVAALALALPSLASARSSYRSGSPGSVTAQNVLGWNGGADGFTPTIIPGAVTAYRSSAYAGTQIIEARYRLWWYIDGWGWDYVGDQTSSRTVNPGEYAQMFKSNPGFRGAELGNKYGLDVIVTYKNQYGTVLGKVRIDFDTATSTDYQCYNDWSRIGTKCFVGTAGGGNISFTPWY